MPCICYGSMTGEEAYDEFINSDEGKKTIEHIKSASSLIMKHKIPDEAIHNVNDIEFRRIFVKLFVHLLVGCDEEIH